MSENLQEKWQPVLSHPDLPEITDPYKKAVTSVVLENQERTLNEERGMISINQLTMLVVLLVEQVLIIGIQF